MYRKIPIFLAGITRIRPSPTSSILSQETTEIPKIALPGVEPPALFIWPLYKHMVCNREYMKQYNYGSNWLLMLWSFKWKEWIKYYMKTCLICADNKSVYHFYYYNLRCQFVCDLESIEIILE
jgi:hypothetical protein